MIDEIKTLKDIPNALEIIDFGVKWINVEELKAEAIKWVKELKEQLPKETFIFTGRYSQNITYNRIGAKIEVLMEKFNLTEEDLK
jgi:GH25 family lysozyme M1 (1,4-beta-N-acetylmuramidase)